MNSIKFKRDTTFRKQFFVPNSFSHPAKMDAQLLIWIVEKFTSPGETILDPMFGSGTTMLSCMLGRNVIGVELEQKFVDMAKANWKKVRQRPQLGSEMGDCQIYQGDARNLQGFLTDKIISSPPYSDSQVPPHTLEGEVRRLEIAKERGVSPDKVSYMDYTKVDKIITSPPYEGSIIDGNENFEGLRKVRGDKVSQKDKFRAVQFDEETTAYGKINHIITSPPYEDSLKHDVADREAEFEKLRAMGYKINPDSADNKVMGDRYSKDDANIGNLKSESYLAAMKTVYEQCFSVLKLGGLMILITKNFIRDRKEVRLDLDTIKLCEASGFTFQERWYRELSAQSFWRIIYKKKYPDAPELKYEDCLVFSKAKPEAFIFDADPVFNTGHERTKEKPLLAS